VKEKKEKKKKIKEKKRERSEKKARDIKTFPSSSRQPWFIMVGHEGY
jgi:hypothetical protein